MQQTYFIKFKKIFLLLHNISLGYYFFETRLKTRKVRGQIYLGERNLFLL